MWHHGMVHATLNKHLPSFDSPIAMEEQRPSLETPTWRSGDRPKLQEQSFRKLPQNGLFLDTKSAIERARRLETARNLFAVMRFCSPVVLSHLDAGFEARCGRKDFWTACCCCLLLLLLVAAAAKMCCSPLDPKAWCKTSTG